MATKKSSTAKTKQVSRVKKSVPPKKAAKSVRKVAVRKPRAAKAARTVTRRRTSKISPLALVRLPDNPILCPIYDSSWENWQTFNPGAILLDDKVHFVYRAIGNDGVSRFGYAASNDGSQIDERLADYVYCHQSPGGAYTYYSLASGGSFGGSEDPRLVRVGDEDKIYLTYTACDNGLRMALTSVGLDDFLAKKWNWSQPVFLSPPYQVQKNWVLFPEKIHGQYAILHSINPEVSIEYRDNLDFAAGDEIESHYGGKDRQNCWDKWIRGAGAPPLKTPEGWLLFYHAMDHDDPGRYKVGAMLLDLEHPEKVLYRSPVPVLEPDEAYENDGYKAGVVYLSGAVIRGEDLLAYYGAADSYVCLARTKLADFLTALKQGQRPSLQKTKLKAPK